MEMDFIVNKEEHKVRLEESGSAFTAEIGGQKESGEAVILDANTISLVLGGRMVTVHVALDGDQIYASVRGDRYRILKAREESVRQAVKARAGMLETERVISTPMPGQIVKIQVREGEIVEANQNLFIVESMKMENQMKSPVRARVEKIHFKDGDSVEANAAIVELSLMDPSHEER